MICCSPILPGTNNSVASTSQNAVTLPVLGKHLPCQNCKIVTSLPSPWRIDPLNMWNHESRAKCFSLKATCKVDLVSGQPYCRWVLMSHPWSNLVSIHVPWVTYLSSLQSSTPSTFFTHGNRHVLQAPATIQVFAVTCSPMNTIAEKCQLLVLSLTILMERIQSVTYWKTTHAKFVDGLKSHCCAANNVTGIIPDLFYETVGPTLEVFVTTGEHFDGRMSVFLKQKYCS